MDAKLDTICQTLAEGKSVDQRKSKSNAKRGKKEEEVVVVEKDVKIEEQATESNGSGESSPTSELTFPEFTEDECMLDACSENFMLQKYPSYEIDWSAL